LGHIAPQLIRRASSKAQPFLTTFWLIGMLQRNINDLAESYNLLIADGDRICAR
jgi:hypothetical protein